MKEALMKRIWQIGCGLSLFLPSLIALSREGSGSIPPPKSYHPPHLWLPPWYVLLDSILSTSIQPSDFSRFYLHSSPQTPPSSGPKWLKKKPFNNLDVLLLLFSLTMLFVVYWRKSNKKEDQTEARALGCDNFNFNAFCVNLFKTAASSC